MADSLARVPRLDGWSAIVTGAGRGVGFETARHLALLGAHVVIAEIDSVTGKAAASAICSECGADAAAFIRTDVGDESSLTEMVQRAGDVDIVVNNATVTPLGPATEVPLERWDESYRVNLRAPATLARLTVPGMTARGRGAFVAISSVGGAYMAPYESLKAAQVELASDLAEELEGTGVYAFSVGPGQVETPGLEAGVRQLAPLYGMAPEEFRALNADHMIPVEDAGAGIAVAIALAERFHGTETSSLAALAVAAQLAADGAEAATAPAPTTQSEAGPSDGSAAALARVIATLEEQVEGWQQRNVFERKWMERDFRKLVGLSAREFLDALRTADPSDARLSELLTLLDHYCEHYAELARGNVRDPEALEAALTAIAEWRADIASSS